MHAKLKELSQRIEELCREVAETSVWLVEHHVGEGTDWYGIVEGGRDVAVDELCERVVERWLLRNWLSQQKRRRAR